MAATAGPTGTVRAKEFHFPLSVEWTGGRRVVARVAGKPELEIAPPPEFRGVDPATWSPEDLFVGAAATCLAVTFTGLAERAGLSYASLEVHGDGVASRRADGRFGFTRLLLRLAVETDPADQDQARELARKADENCLVSVSLDVPVELEVELRTFPQAASADPRLP